MATTIITTATAMGRIGNDEGEVWVGVGVAELGGGVGPVKLSEFRIAE